jgi:hypothetical protein
LREVVREQGGERHDQRRPDACKNIIEAQDSDLFDVLEIVEFASLMSDIEALTIAELGGSISCARVPSLKLTVKRLLFTPSMAPEFALFELPPQTPRRQALLRAASD